MDAIDSGILAPDIIRRDCGGYLVLTKKIAPIRIGAIGKTRDEAIATYNKMIKKWWDARQVEELVSLNSQGSYTE